MRSRAFFSKYLEFSLSHVLGLQFQIRPESPTAGRQCWTGAKKEQVRYTVKNELRVNLFSFAQSTCDLQPVPYLHPHMFPAFSVAYSAGASGANVTSTK